MNENNTWFEEGINSVPEKKFIHTLLCQSYVELSAFLKKIHPSELIQVLPNGPGYTVIWKSHIQYDYR